MTLRIGLTGGIATGKSTVSRMLAELGAAVIDADAIAREVVEPGRPAWREIVGRFGEAVLGPDGALDRRRLGGIVFADERAREDLNRIVHPRVAEEMRRRAEAAGRAGTRIVVLDIPLLFEVGWRNEADKVLVVAASPEIQLKRLMARDRFNLQEARARVDAQTPLAEKIRQADFVIINDGNPAETRGQVEELWKRLEALADAQASGSDRA
ncbi:MAG: dephospho-CoA kinase [Firmicutes bacterium]|nr:dephospho-CoA kinase [Bacillota bacterium]